TPREFVDRRANRQRSVGDTARNDDPRSAGKRLDDSSRSQIGISARDAGPQICQRGPSVEIGEWFAGGEQLVESREDVIARNRRHFYGIQARARENRGGLPGAFVR